MDKLWAPWRAKYFKIKRPKHCIFCPKEKTKNFIIHKTKYSLSVLNIFPYNTGHIMVAPKRHTSDLKKLKDPEIIDLIKHVNLMQDLLSRELSPQGFNIGINLGKIAGAGIQDHVHIHIVPRWQGDTNFMPIVASTKVMPESLLELKKRLVKRLKNA